MKKFIKIAAIILAIMFVLFAILLFSTYQNYAKNLPDVSDLKTVKLQTPLEVYTADSKLMAIFGEHRRIPLTYEEIPAQLINAIIATEDSRFFEHKGIDIVGIARAMVVAVTSGNVSQGASTITQQVAKNFFLSSERSVERKLKEAILAMRIEEILTKQEILTLYLNKIYLGSRAYGVGAAAYTYFGKTVNELTLSEIATIAGLPKAPSSYNPIHFFDKAVARRDIVLQRMLIEEFITEEEYNQAKNEPLVAAYHEPKIDFSAPYIAEMVRQELYKQMGENAYEDGYKVYTTIASERQTQADKAVADNIISYDMRHGYRGATTQLWKKNKDKPFSQEKIIETLKNYSTYPPLIPGVVTKVERNRATVYTKNNEEIEITYDGIRWARKFITDNRQGASPASVSSVIKEGELIWVRKENSTWWLTQIPEVNSSLVALNSQTGAIEAIVGGFDFSLSNFNRATQSVRQIGSTIKPFIYAAALTKGMTLSTLLDDSPIKRVIGNKIWAPKNSPNVYAGPLRIRVGIGLSKNMMVIRAMRAVGVDYTANYLQRFGFPSSNIPRTESLALGTAAFTPLQLARGFTVFNNGGYLVTPYFIDRIESHKNEIIYKAEPLVACVKNCIDPVIYGEDSKINVALKDTENESAPVGEEDLDNTENLITESGVEELNIEEKKKNKTKKIEYAPRVISEEIAFLIQDLLKTNIWGESGSYWKPVGWRVQKVNRHDIGGKTGTTNSSKDAWFSGFANDLVISVWIGFDDHRRSLGRGRFDPSNPNSGAFGEDGGKAATPAWIDFARMALKDVPEKKYTVPEGIVKLQIERDSGNISRSSPYTEYFIKSVLPKNTAISRRGLPTKSSTVTSTTDTVPRQIPLKPIMQAQKKQTTAPEPDKTIAKPKNSGFKVINKSGGMDELF